MPATLWSEQDSPAGESIRIWCYEGPQIGPGRHWRRDEQELHIRNIAAGSTVQKSHRARREVACDPGPEKLRPRQINRDPISAHPPMQGTAATTGIYNGGGHVVLQISPDA